MFTFLKIWQFLNSKILYINIGGQYFIYGVGIMNPKLVKFTVELQTGDVEVKTEKQVEFKDTTKFFNFLKTAKVTVPVRK